ncbi:MAG: hypothetical protein A3D94_14920 [Alphaproteobacteria bacterium RIFCSPHIGHO2_12_FULL_66_14]|nr:MAG: hypothetical protein A3D94_14920 [Alphaproteobacteria bacterium RIFCSPHIGHO2_12_FULL_66_14]
MFKAIAAGTLATVLLAGAAHAEGPAYTWTGYGVGSGKCPTYKMTINVTLEGNEVKGLFQQEGRPQRHFEVNMAADKSFKTRAVVGNNNMIDVIGSLKDGAPKIMLDGYCLFEGPLIKK